MITECIDVSNLDAVKKAVESLAPIHLLVNNAGVTRLQHFLDVTSEAYDQYIKHASLSKSLISSPGPLSIQY